MYKIFEFAEEKGMERGIQKGMQKGMERGIAQGRDQGKAELLLKILASRFDRLPQKYSDKIYKLSVEKVEEISINAFKLQSLKDLEAYFKSK